MDSLTIIDIICMLLNREGPHPQANLDVLKSLYERTHARYMAVLIVFAVLTAVVLGVFVGAVLEWGETKIAILAVVALIAMMISPAVVAAIMFWWYGNMQRWYQHLSRSSRKNPAQAAEAGGVMKLFTASLKDELSP